MERHSVSSSNLHSIGYEPETETLEIKFLKSGVYHYFNVPINIYKELISAYSKGAFFDKYIKKRHC
jgi:hypothetical protein